MPGKLVRNNEDEAVFRKPLAERLWYGVSLVGAICMGTFVVHACESASADKDTVSSVTMFSLVIILILSLGAAAQEMRFDFRRKRYLGRTGFAFLSWTYAGDFSEMSQLGVWKTAKFTGLSIEWKGVKRSRTAFVSCSTGRDAEALAEILAPKLGLQAGTGVRWGRKRLSR